MNDIIAPSGQDGWISSIALRFYGSDLRSDYDHWMVVSDAIAAFNGLPDRDTVKAGYRLRAPASVGELLRRVGAADIIPQAEPETFVPATPRPLGRSKDRILIFGPEGTVLTSRYGHRGGLVLQDGTAVPPGFHPGEDYANHKVWGDARYFGSGWSLPAPVSGEVVWSAAMGGFGNVCVIKTERPIALTDGRVARWVMVAHADRLLAQVGDAVVQGKDPILRVGASGMSTAPHIHLALLCGQTHLEVNDTADPGPFTLLVISELLDWAA